MSPNANLRNFFSSLEEQTKPTDSIENNTAIDDCQSSTHRSFWKRWKSNPETMTAKGPDHEEDVSIVLGEKVVVSFAPSVQVRPIPSILDYTEEEKDAIWYTSQDYERIFAIVDRIVDKMEQGVKLKKKDCPRGLEYMTEQSYFEKKSRRRVAIQAVLLDQQSTYREFGEEQGPYILAKRYSKLANESRIAARLEAQQDEWDVKDYMSPNRDMVMAQAFHHMSFQKRIRERMNDEPQMTIKDALDSASEEVSMEHEKDVEFVSTTRTDHTARLMTRQLFVRPRRADGSFHRLRMVDETLKKLISVEAYAQEHLKNVFRQEGVVERRGVLLRNVVTPKTA
jgi:hypothetical protein